MSQTKDSTRERVESLLKSSAVKEYYEQVVAMAKDQGVDFNNFDSILSNLNTIGNIAWNLYKQDKGIKFNGAGDELLLDVIEYHAPGLSFSLYPDYSIIQKIECYKNSVERSKNLIIENKTGPFKDFTVDFKDGCMHLNDCGHEVDLNTIEDYFNHQILRCDNQYSFSSPFNADINRYVEDSRSSIGEEANFQQGSEL